MYEKCMTREFDLRKIPYRHQVPLPIHYKGLDMGIGYRADFVVANELVVELKAVERLLPIHEAQVLTYLKVLGLRQAFLINFCVPRLMTGFRSLLNGQLRGEFHAPHSFTVD
jgi:GxxExxY protein